MMLVINCPCAGPVERDYVQGSNIITFGSATTGLMECVTVMINDNEDLEPDEMFSIQLTAAQAPLVIDESRRVANVTIPQDN